MKYSEKKIKKLNDLLIMNYEVEKVYSEALDIAVDENLKTFFRERGFERNEFGRELRTEIKKLDAEPRSMGSLSSDFYQIWMNFRNLLLTNNENELLDEVYKIKKMSVDRYNALLRETNLPLSLCKMLIRHRDDLQASMHVIKREAQFVA